MRTFITIIMLFGLTGLYAQEENILFSNHSKVTIELPASWNYTSFGDESYGVFSLTSDNGTAKATVFIHYKTVSQYKGLEPIAIERVTKEYNQSVMPSYANATVFSTTSFQQNGINGTISALTFFEETPETMVQMYALYFIDEDGNFYTVTMTSPAVDFNQYENIFNHVLSSLRLK